MPPQFTLNATVICNGPFVRLAQRSAAAGENTGARLNAEFDAIYSVLTGGQIAFPATQNPSADPNTLDDYEEGTWTPTLTFLTPGDLNVVYSLRTAAYTKIGNLINIVWLMSTSTFTHTTASGIALITGLPFDASLEGFGGMQLTGFTKANYTDFSCDIQPGFSRSAIIASGSGQPSGALNTADMPTGGTVVVCSSTTYPEA